MRKLKHPIILAIVLGCSFLPASLATAQQDKVSDYRWLLESPLGSALSGAGEIALRQEYGMLPSSEPTMKEAVPFSVRIEYSSAFVGLQVNDSGLDTPENTTQSETAIAKSRHTILVGFNDSGEFSSSGFLDLTGYSRWNENHKRWDDMGSLDESAGSNEKDLGDPCIVADRKGIFYFATLGKDSFGRSIIAIRRSLDDGLTFSPPVNSGVANYSKVQDKEWMAVDNTSGRCDANLYLSWTEFSSWDNSQILFSRSTNRAMTNFTNVQPLSPLFDLSNDSAFVQFSMPAVGPNGEVYVVWEEIHDWPQPSFAYIKLRKSVDCGVTFGEEITVAKISPVYDPDAVECCGRPALNGQIRVGDAPIIAVDQSGGATNGNVYIAFNSRAQDNADIFATVSLDGGISWSVPVRVNDDATLNDQWLPWLAVNPNGVVGVMWYDRRNDPYNLMIDVYFACSNDGIVWTPNRRITDSSFPVPPICPSNFDNMIVKCYAGDYNNMIADEHYFYLTWGDNRNTVYSMFYPNGRPDPDVFFAKVRPCDVDSVATIYIDPSLTVVRDGYSGTFDVKIDDVINLGAFEFELQFDASNMQVTGVIPGPFLGSTGRSVTPLPPIIDNALGTISFGMFSTGTTPPGPTGSNGLLATIAFDVLLSVECDSVPVVLPLTFNSDQASDIFGDVIPTVTKDGEIEVLCGYCFDVDNDGDVDIVDIQLVAGRWPSVVGDPNYDSRYDVDNCCMGDGDIDIVDIQLVASHFGESGPPWPHCESVPDFKVGKASSVGDTEEVILSLHRKLIDNTSSVLYQLCAEISTYISAFQFDVAPKTTQVSVQNIRLGELLQKSENTVIALEPKFDSQTRVTTFGAVSFGKYRGAKGVGVLAEFEVIGTNGIEIPVDVVNIQLTDINGEILNHSFLGDINSKELISSAIPQNYVLYQNYPNPFNASTMIRFDIPDNGVKTDRLRLSIYNLQGQLVRRLIDEEKIPGAHAIVWDGTDDRNQAVASGVYILSLQVGEFLAKRKMLLIK